MTRLHRIPLVLLCLLAAPAAWGQSLTLHQSELWKTYTARTSKGQALCGIGTAFENGRQLYIKWFEGTDNLVVQIFKAGWAIPPDVSSPVIFRLDRTEPWSVRTVRLGRVTDFLEFPIGNDKVRLFTHDFTVSRTMAIQFPGGSEPSWTVDLEGNSAAIDALVRCIQDVAGPNDTMQPYAYLRGVVAPQPLMPAPLTTQPFGGPRIR